MRRLSRLDYVSWPAGLLLRHDRALVVGRNYAGTLGLLTFVAVLARGLIRGSSASATLQAACLVLFAFAAIGYVVGQIAHSIVEQSVHGRMRRELADLENADDAAV